MTAFTNAILLPIPVEAAVKIFSDISILTQNHPLIESAVQVFETDRYDVNVKTYDIVDKIPMWGREFKVEYTASVAVSNSTISWTTRAPLWIRTSTSYLIRSCGNGCRVSEVTFVRGPPILAWYAASVAKASHKEMMQRLQDSYVSHP